MVKVFSKNKGTLSVSKTGHALQSDTQKSKDTSAHVMLLDIFSINFFQA